MPRWTREQGGQVARSSVIVTYTALVVLLLAFFILLNSLGRVEEARLEAALRSLKSSFGAGVEGGWGPWGETVAPAAEGEGPAHPADEDYFFLRGLARRGDLLSRLTFLRGVSHRTVVVEAGLLFASGGAELDDKGREFLDQAAAVIADDGYPVSVLGHTDDAAPAGDGPDNFTLSAQRALAVARHLAARGVDPRRLAAYGLAGNRPLVANDTPAGRARNQRVELVFDARDPGRHRLPDQAGPRRLDFRGFTFDLAPEGR